MLIQFGYDKKQVLQALRYHFLSRPEIKILLILVNVFAIVSAGLFFFKKISPLAFLISSVLWFVLMIVFWFLMGLAFALQSIVLDENRTLPATVRVVAR